MKALIIIYFEMRMNFNCYVCTVFENEKKEKKNTIMAFVGLRDFCSVESAPYLSLQFLPK